MSMLDNTDLITTTHGIPDESVSPPASKSTSWRHARGKPTRRDKAASQQYLTPHEETAVLEYVLRMDERGYPPPVKFQGSIAHVIKRQRSSAFQALTADDGIHPPGKNWPQGFRKRHPELLARKSDL